MAKELGAIRRIDELGRIVIPKGMRKVLGLNSNDEVDISMEDGCIFIKKKDPACLICGAKGELIPFRGKTVCKTCTEEIKTLF